MPNQLDLTTHSHCVVQWEEKTNNNQPYAIVDSKRAKTVSSLKVGISIVFEGYQRERRRGKILYLGSKKDCFTFGFDVAEENEQVNFYSWSGPPGLREQSEELAQSIRNGVSSSSTFQRTTSSSSVSSIASVNKPKRKKLVDKNPTDIDNSTTSNDTAMPPPPSPTTSTTSSSTLMNSITTNDGSDQQLNSNNPSSTSMSNSSSTNTDHGKKSLTGDNDSLLEENKKLREKIMALQEELAYRKENSIPLPSEETYKYMKFACTLYENARDEKNKQALDLGKKLPCTEAQLMLAKNPNPARTINNLVKLCFKDHDLTNLCYTKLKAIDATTLDNIHKYVNCIHAPREISQSYFSEKISVKSRHLRAAEKEGKSKTESNKQPGLQRKRKNPKQKDAIDKENIEPSNDELVGIEAMNPDEDSNDRFD